MPVVLPAQRCGGCRRFVSGEMTRCPYCERPRALPTSSRDTAPSDANLTVFLGFAALLVLALAFHFADRNSGNVSLMRVAAFEGLSTLVVLGCALLSQAPFVVVEPPQVRPSVAWVGGLLLVLVAAFLNQAYHEAVRNLFAWSAHRSVDASNATIALICVQPALVEEFFFRHLAFRAFRDSHGVHATVAMTALMFGFAHVGQLIGLPILLGMGFLLGYARVASGSLLLPIALHFLHNLLVLGAPSR